MQYQINPSAYRSVFVVPADVVDRHLRFAGAAQLKVLLWALRSGAGAFDAEGAAQALNLSRMDAADAIQYWVEAGIVSCTDGEAAPEAETQYAVP